jgi:hypothetical protein
MGNINAVNECKFINVSHNTHLSTYSFTNNIKPSNSNVSINNAFLLPEKAHENSYNNICKFSVYHQNITGLRHKFDELLISLSPNLPRVLCNTEHHLTNAEIDGVFAPQYAFGGSSVENYIDVVGCVFLFKIILVFFK